MDGERKEFLIVGLGNPGTKYEKTRHNLGFLVIEALSKKYGLGFKRGWRLDGRVASGAVDGEKVTLLLPSTYMNLSGTAIRKALHYFKLKPADLLVVVDEAYIKFGAMRLRPSGSPGGHNGLKNIDACLHTQEYARLRVGVGPQSGELPNGLPLEEYVLAAFTAEEQQALPQVTEKGISVIECWLKRGLEAASQLAGNLSQK